MKTMDLFLLLLLSASCTQPDSKVNINAESLLGIWECIEGCEYLQYEFYKEETTYGFYVYSGQRMYTSGLWELEGNRITMKYEEGNSVSYEVEERGDSLIFGKKEMVFVPYEAYETSEEDDLEYLESLLLSTPQITFSEPEPVEFSWYYPSDSVSTEEAKIDGRRITTPVILKGDFEPFSIVERIIINNLFKEGFDYDNYNVTEIASGFCKDNMVLWILPLKLYEEAEGEVFLRVDYGVLPE